MKLHTRLRDIHVEKEEIEKMKKKAKSNKKRPLVPDAFGKTSIPLPLQNECSEYDLEESEFLNVDKNEQKEIYQFKMKMFENEEKRIKE